jgi:hypothetical protein
MTSVEVNAGAPVDDVVKHDDAENVHDEKMTPLVLIKYVLSVAILIFSIVLVGALMFTGNTRIASETSPWVSLIVCVSSSRRYDYRVCQPIYFMLLPLLCLTNKRLLLFHSYRSWLSHGLP